MHNIDLINYPFKYSSRLSPLADREQGFVMMARSRVGEGREGAF